VLTKKAYRTEIKQEGITRAFEKLILLLLSLTLPATLGSAETISTDSKLDPMLKMLSQKAISISTAKTMNMVKEVPDQEQMVKTIVRFKDNLNGIDSLGGKIGFNMLIRLTRKGTRYSDIIPQNLKLEDSLINLQTISDGGIVVLCQNSMTLKCFLSCTQKRASMQP